MRVLVTGGAGYVGTSVVDALCGCEQIGRVVVFDNLIGDDLRFFFHDKKYEKLRFVKGDILDHRALLRVLEGGVDALVHLAAFTAQPFNHLQHLQYEQVNRWGTSNVIRTANEPGRVSRLLMLSSTAVYGFRENIVPGDEPAPENAYALSKAEAEKYLPLFEGESCLLRASNVFGYNRRWRTDAVINKLFCDALLTNRITLYGNGQQFRPFVHVKSLAASIKDWVVEGSAPGRVALDFNASMNAIRDFLVEALPGLEFQHLNQMQPFPSQRIPGDEVPTEQIHQSLRQSLADFKNHCLLHG